MYVLAVMCATFPREYPGVMEHKAQKTFKLHRVTVANLETLSKATGSNSTAVVEMAVAFLYSHLFGPAALLENTRFIRSDSGLSDEPQVPDAHEMSGSGVEETQTPGTLLKARRIELGLSRVELAKACKVSEGTIRRYEGDSYKASAVSWEIVRKLARGLQWEEQALARHLNAQHLL